MHDIRWYQINLNKKKTGVKQDVRPPRQGRTTPTYPAFWSRSNGPFPASPLPSPVTLYQQNLREQQQRSRRNRAIAVILLFLTLLGSGGALVMQFGQTSYQRVYANAQSGQQHLQSAKDALLMQDFSTAITEFSLARTEFTDAQTTLEPFAKVPISQTVTTAYALVKSGALLSSAGEKACAGIVPAYELLTATSGEHGLSLTTGTFLKELMVTLSASEPSLREAYTDAQEAQALLQNIDGSVLDSALQERLDKVKTALPSVVDLLDISYHASEFMPQLLGNGASQRYMVLFLNNNELRPTGGFLSSFFNIIVEKAAIKDMYAKNVYDIEGQLKEYVEPPEPLKNQWPNINWGMRDCLWDPDFQVAVPMCEWFYQRAVGETVDGFIAINPEVIKNVLRLLGEQSVWSNGQTIQVNADNFVSVIDDQERRAKEGTDPRKFLIDLSDIVIKKLMEIKKEQWPMLASILRQALEERQMLLHFSNQQANDFILSKHWGGALEDTNRDYLAVFDSNINGSKSSQLISVEYNLDVTVSSDGSMRHKLSLVYQHNGTNVLPSAPTRNYTRIYVPLGSKLLSAQGTKEGVTQVTQSGDRTVFADYVTINPGETLNIAYTYETPLKLLDSNLSTYGLYIQKQSGTVGHNVRFSLNLPPTIKAVSTEKKIEVTSENSVWFFETLKKDISFEVLLKKL